MFATLVVRVTYILLFVLHREIREINVSQKFHVIRYEKHGETLFEPSLKLCY